MNRSLICFPSLKNGVVIRELFLVDFSSFTVFVVAVSKYLVYSFVCELFKC